MRKAIAGSMTDVESSPSYPLDLSGGTISAQEWERMMKRWRQHLKVLRMPKLGSGRTVAGPSESQAKPRPVLGSGPAEDGPNPCPIQARPSSSQAQDLDTGGKCSDSAWLANLRVWIGGLIAHCARLRQTECNKTKKKMRRRRRMRRNNEEAWCHKRPRPARTSRLTEFMPNSSSSDSSEGSTEYPGMVAGAPLHNDNTECSHGRMCKRRGCWHHHPQGREIDDNPSSSLCKFGDKCSRVDCFYVHVVPPPSPSLAHVPRVVPPPVHVVSPPSLPKAHVPRVVPPGPFCDLPTKEHRQNHNR